MKTINKQGIDEEREVNNKLNIQTNKVQKANNQIAIENCSRNKKFNYIMKNIDEKKRFELKVLESNRDIIKIKDIKKKKIEKYSDSICPKISFQTIGSIIKNNFNALKLQSVNTENLKKQRYLKNLKIDKLNEIQKQKRKKNIIEKNIAFRTYFEIIIMKSLIINILI